MNWSEKLRGLWWTNQPLSMFNPWTGTKIQCSNCESRQQMWGKVIGKQGRTARSVRTILGAVSMKLHHRYTLDILEEDDEG